MLGPIPLLSKCTLVAPLDSTNKASSTVAIHGLDGHREKTWTAKNEVNWLRDLIPEHIPNARILTWGYDANTHSRTRVSCQ